MLTLSDEYKIFACRNYGFEISTYLVIIPHVEHDHLILSSLNINGKITNQTHETAAFGIKTYYDLILKGWRIMTLRDIEITFGIN